MTGYKTIPQRMFVKDRKSGEIVFLKDVSVLNICDEEKEGELIGITIDNIPEQLDTIFPLEVYLVFQLSETDDQFYDSLESGLCIILSGFQVKVRLGEPCMLKVSAATGEVFRSESEFFFSFTRMRKQTS